MAVRLNQPEARWQALRRAAALFNQTLQATAAVPSVGDGAGDPRLRAFVGPPFPAAVPELLRPQREECELRVPSSGIVRSERHANLLWPCRQVYCVDSETVWIHAC